MVLIRHGKELGEWLRAVILETVGPGHAIVPPFYITSNAGTGHPLSCG
jgi:hypothetical protein